MTRSPGKHFKLILVKYLFDKAHAAVIVELLPFSDINRADARAFLAAVLERMKAVIARARTASGMTEYPEYAAFFAQFIKHIVMADAFIIMICLSTAEAAVLFHQTWNRILPDLLQLFNRRL